MWKMAWVTLISVGVLGLADSSHASRYVGGNDAQLIVGILNSVLKGRMDEKEAKAMNLPIEPKTPPQLRSCAGDKVLVELDKSIEKLLALWENLERVTSPPPSLSISFLSISFEQFLSGFLTKRQMENLPKRDLEEFEKQWRFGRGSNQLAIMLDYTNYIKRAYEYECGKSDPQRSFVPEFNFFAGASAAFLRSKSAIPQKRPEIMTKAPFSERAYPSEVSGE